MLVYPSWISGVTVGLELFLGADLDPDEKFAMVIHLGILRVTVIVPK